MAGSMRKDDSGGIHVPLMTSREPKGPTTAGGKGSTGDEAFKDAVAIVLICWAILFALGFSLRHHNA